MFVTETNAGITSEHIDAISSLCKQLNVFILIRPCTVQSMQLIKAGYATKSMDIHDKSSDWGPMAGLVPCDPAFSKTATGQPKPNALYHTHGKAQPVALRLTASLATPGINPNLVWDTSNASTANVRYVKSTRHAEGGVRATPFELRAAPGGEWGVFWTSAGTAVPLMVWGYQVRGQVKPVTGDYDLWMVAPHVKTWEEHHAVVDVGDSHGDSSATLYITELLFKLNAACGRLGNPVFHHGAEAQNYGFTQALDRTIAMFTPGGFTEMVTSNDLPAALTDMQQAGYLVYWNKRFGESDPQLMGKRFSGGVATGGISGVTGLIAEAQALMNAPKTGNALHDELRRSPGVQRYLLGSGGEAQRIQDIQNFHANLTRQMNALAQGGRTWQRLRPRFHLPQWVIDESQVDAARRQSLQQTLQAVVMKISEPIHGSKYEVGTQPGGRQTTPVMRSPMLTTWENWRTSNPQLVQQLEHMFGDAQPKRQFELIPGTRSYKSKGKPVKLN